MKNVRDVVVVAYGRSPMCKANKGGFSKTHPVEFAAQTLMGVLDKVPKLDRSLIDDVIVGCANPDRECFFNIGRVVAQRAGLPDCVPGRTVNRFCASGLQSVADGAAAIASGQMDIVVAGGVEYMTGLSMEPNEAGFDHKLIEMKPDTYLAMGLTAENVAKMYGITREEMDQMAVDSHRKASAAQEAGKFVDEIIPITIDGPDGPLVLTEDEGIRKGTTLEKLSQLKPCFKEDGVVTAATSSQMTDGASFLVLMAREVAKSIGCKPVAEFIGFGVAGVPAGIMGIGPIRAIPKALEKVNMKIEDMDVIELNEAFASQAIACIRDLNIPLEKLNPNGGGMALGHPLGATGAFLSCKAFSELKRTGGKYALIAMCIGGGMGAAGIYRME